MLKVQTQIDFLGLIYATMRQFNIAYLVEWNTVLFL